MEFGKNLKRLRETHGYTQADVADILGVTYQSVSKWERDENYPDVALLPALAEYLEVTVDELLRADEERKQKEILRIREESLKICNEQSSDAAAEYLKDALRDYPTAWRLWHDYAAYIGVSIRVNSDRPIDGEAATAAIEIYDRILNRCTDDDVRVDALRSLAGCYQELGDKEKALELAERLPSWAGCREIMLPHYLEGEERAARIRQNFAEAALHFHTLTMFVADADNNTYAPAPEGYTLAERVAILEKGAKAIELLSDGDESYAGYFTAYSYRNMARLAAADGRNEDALEYLERACGFALSSAAETGAKFKSLLLRGMQSYNTGDEAIRQLREFLKPDAWQYNGVDPFAALRGDTRFIAIAERLAK
ncbi:MAG: helix-turn-helix domain-containing protein [Oscillospiraceae bacterium]|jgi:transcriptional regulator with XRE-family HTH domain|nr:helix-turn-helix domain-containing protein [Oscillospiraceae bacterium]